MSELDGFEDLDTCPRCDLIVIEDFIRTAPTVFTCPNCSFQLRYKERKKNNK